MTALREEPTSDRTRTGTAVTTAEARSRQEVGDADPTTSAKVKPVTEASTKPSKAAGDTAPVKLDDFGEKLEGARKFLPPALKEALTESDIADQPLSKLWLHFVGGGAQVRRGEERRRRPGVEAGWYFRRRDQRARDARLKRSSRRPSIVVVHFGVESATTISGIENGRINLGVERANVLGAALRCHPAVLVFPGWQLETAA
ncbi:MAG: hypothetical protein K8F35_09720 [Dokdonella sp.]|uniref:hypothetical protein n=1 Tax=Dokdonella sp. TaxID=2291710 RepID=UPI0025C05FD0|nr:hypothetical protein [Dokdonella sp.]MBZ0223296.1 hypothetical protein [Dokdonella sp.]